MYKLPISVFIIAAMTFSAAFANAPASATVPAEPPGARALAVVANTNLGVRDIAFSTLRRAFGGETTELAGQRLIPFNHPPKDDARLRFDKVVLKLAPEMIGPYWVDRRLRGQNGPPKTVPEPAVLVAVIAHIPGGIGYVPIELSNSTVTVLTVDGKSTTDPDYPLR